MASHEDKDFNPRKEGKHHWHEEIVRPVKVNPEIAFIKDPLKDMYMDNQDRKHKGRDIGLPSRCIQVHLTEMAPREVSNPHKHHNEAVVYIVKGKGHSIVQGARIDWEAGDFFYIPPFCWHTHYNETDDTSVYMGITNKKLLNFLGLDRKLEVGQHVTQEEIGRAHV